ncbi:BTD [Branchiostoma lanceolatum]|uniref:BTD protein n=1 Tax=Branchiostoma lanceolatum TaxID=7740 RepID=A0A8K0EFL9_BRALA|nr:BTD [Branchiostoma lanceolatum]
MLQTKSTILPELHGSLALPGPPSSSSPSSSHSENSDAWPRRRSSPSPSTSKARPAVSVPLIPLLPAGGPLSHPRGARRMAYGRTGARCRAWGHCVYVVLIVFLAVFDTHGSGTRAHDFQYRADTPPSPLRCCHDQLQQGTPTSYVAAVYEHDTYLLQDPHRVLNRPSALELMKKNLQVFEGQARSATKQGAQIIVFPEDGIYGMAYTRHSIFPFLEDIPDPSVESWNPCLHPNQHSDTEVLHILSCHVEVCDNALCCQLDYTMSLKEGELYAFGAFDGLHTFQGQYYLQVCVLLKCQSNIPSSCGTGITSASTSFSFLHMAGNFSTSYVYPEVTTDGVSLAPPSEWKYEAQAISSAKGVSKPVLSAGLYGRWYDRD